MHQHCCVDKYKPVTHVIFDLDGTIIDSETVYVRALKETVKEYGYELDDEYIPQIKGRVESDLGKIIMEAYPIDVTVEKFLDEYHERAYSNLADLNLLPGVERTIRHLHANNVPIAIATSSLKYSFDIKTKKFEDLFSLFSHVVCGGDDPEVKNGKPAPDIFLIAAGRFPSPRPDPSKCLVFEDSTNGVLGALAAGMQVVMLPENDIPYETWQLATMRLDSFNYFIPGMFGLPPFPQEEIAQVFANTKVTLVASMKEVFLVPPEEEQPLEVKKPDSEEEEIEAK